MSASKPLFLMSLQRLYNLTRGDGLRAQLLRGGMGSVGVKIGQTALAFMVSVVLARTLGAEGFGVYSFAYSLMMVLAIPAQLGLPQLVVRETARAQANGDWGLMRGVWRWSTIGVLLFTIVIAVITAIIVVLVGGSINEEKVSTLLFGLVLIPLVALGNLRGAALRGLHRVVMGQLPESIIRPGIFIVLIFTSVLVFSGFRLTPSSAMGIQVIAAAIAFTIGAYLLMHSCPSEVTERPTPVYESRHWIGAAMPLALVAGLQLIIGHTDVLMLGLLRTDEEVGIYRAVAQVSLLVGFGLQIAHMLIAPYVSRFHAQDDERRLQKIIKIGAQVVFAATAPILVFFILFGDQLLIFLFGATFGTAYAALVILALGRFASATLGPVGLVLQMTGYEKETAAGVALAAGLNILLNLLLIPQLGITGAALATAMSLIISHIVLHRFVLLRLGIEASAMPSLQNNVCR